MKNIVRIFCFVVLAFCLPPHSLHAQHVQVHELPLSASSAPHTPVLQRYELSKTQSSSGAEGRYIITPDDNGNLNFDTVLAVKLQSALSSSRIAANMKGACAALLIPGKGIWQGASGISSELDSVKPAMLFNIASNTKTFTASLMMKLAEDGRLSLDDSLNKYLPKFNNIRNTITIRQLLNMTSGLFDILNDAGSLNDAIFADPNHRFTPEELLGFVGAEKQAPGEGFRYTNTAYVLAGMIIKKITSLPISVFLRQRILD